MPGESIVSSVGQPVDRLLCERLENAGGLTLTRVVVTGDWTRQHAGAAYGYVVAGEATFAVGNESVTATRGDCFAVPGSVCPTVRSTPENGRTELLVGSVDPAHTESTETVNGVAADRVDAVTGIAVAGPETFEPAAELSQVTRRTPFPNAPVRLVRGRSSGEIVSDWHHHGDSHVFGYVLTGDGYVEWGTGENERRLVDTGESFHIPPEFVHRDRSTSAGDQEYVLWLTGSKPWTVDA